MIFVYTHERKKKIALWMGVLNPLQRMLHGVTCYTIDHSGSFLAHVSEKSSSNVTCNP
jgi:hypothetical protein